MSFWAYFGTAVGVGVINASITKPGVESDWYAKLKQPCSTPPRAVFSWVWGLNYILIAWSTSLVDNQLSREGKNANPLRIAFALQMLFMLLWTQSFFGNRNPKQALWFFLALILAALWEFWILVKQDGFAALLFAPYLIWLFLAFSINLALI